MNKILQPNRQTNASQSGLAILLTRHALIRSFKPLHTLVLSSGLLLGLTTTATAACPTAASTVFSCTTSKGKQVNICNAGSSLNYSFGKPNKPELTFSLPKARAYKYLWSGMTSSEWNEVYLPRGNTTYVAYQANHRNHGGEEYGLNVLINGKQAANIRCASNIRENISDINLREIGDDERP